MAELAGMRETGRTVRGPVATLVELEDAQSTLHLSLQFREEYRGLEALTRAVELALSFLEFPMVPGVVDLKARGEGTFLYETGPVWTLQELIRQYRDAGQALGVRPAMDLVYLAAGILTEAGENGPVQGVFSHGGLTPNRILVDGDGQVTILGYGIPQVEVTAFLKQEVALEPREDSWRYCPPERLVGSGEDADADLYALCLIAWEVMTGEPLYTGDAAEVRRKASHGEGARLFREQLGRGAVPDEVLHVLSQAMEFDPAQRYADGHELLRALYETFTAIELPGPTLAEVMARVGPAPKRGRALVSAGAASTAVSGDPARRAPPGRGLGGRVHRAPGGGAVAAQVSAERAARYGKGRGASAELPDTSEPARALPAREGESRFGGRPSRAEEGGVPARRQSEEVAERGRVLAAPAAAEAAPDEGTRRFGGRPSRSSEPGEGSVEAARGRSVRAGEAPAEVASEEGSSRFGGRPSRAAEPPAEVAS
ncbi:MAG: hypothetical protein JXX28_00580, partial [Deltaproteobacteria bacterium]|nr:hypothetical protein [Deltaproteobacteria bacterium]